VATAGSSGTEVRYVSAVGEDVVTTWGALDGAEAVRGLPVRRIPSHAGQRHCPGSFWSATTGAHVGYESRLELDRLWLADLDPTVAWIASQPVWLCGDDRPARRRHAPDLLLQHADGSFALVDVKPAAFVDVPRVAEVFAWTGRLRAAKGWRYEVWSGASAVLMDDVRWLGGTRRPELLDSDALDVVQHVALTGMTLRERARCLRATGHGEPGSTRDRVVVVVLRVGRRPAGAVVGRDGHRLGAGRASRPAPPLPRCSAIRTRLSTSRSRSRGLRLVGWDSSARR